MKEIAWLWIARGVCFAILVSLLIRNAETGKMQILPIVMAIALVASFVYPLLQNYRRND
ncbi:hypothetical protein [Tropicibacter naphthalenivorans]|uniref:Uncharacterized protein n=1 Tax=Tropicibacter naphthalenivorans TaxID=441103 RepID=A0A0N7M1A1_9RHOB|nr:hypothetical protein [Tropicibacter naphthalenivorans]CUH82689.1 hypothetical protein TRN7648_04232 [Tropicibacter naphthalenivorans]SMD11203.1 hypothetical protein SAMN04488093_12513 [Tropicibacter naphthalenivorans]